MKLLHEAGQTEQTNQQQIEEVQVVYPAQQQTSPTVQQQTAQTAQKQRRQAKQKQIHVVGAVFLRAGKVLAAKRGLGRNLAGFWEFPGGKIEAGESGAQALARELREELLVTVEVGDFLARAVYEYSFGVVTLDTYFCRILHGELCLTEHQEIRWLAPEELFSVQWAPADMPIIQQLAAKLSVLPAVSETSGISETIEIFDISETDYRLH